MKRARRSLGRAEAQARREARAQAKRERKGDAPEPQDLYPDVVPEDITDVDEEDC